MDFHDALATSLGFPRPQYTAVERERRWLCREVPRELVRETWTVADLYVTGTRLRLREMRSTDGRAAMLKLSRKADVDERTRLITSIYLPEAEFAVLAAALRGQKLTKIRYRLRAPDGVLVSVDAFQGTLAGLLLCEAEFKTDEAMNAFEMPGFCEREVTAESGYTGIALARE